MAEDAGNSTDTSTKSSEPGTPPIWLQASIADVDGFDFEAPIRNSRSADPNELSDVFGKEAGEADAKGDKRSHRVFAMLGAATGMLFRPYDKNAPYGAMMTLADGRRSPIPEDFRGVPLDVLAHFAERSTHPALRANLSDVCWLLDKRRHQLGRAAVASFVETVTRVRSGDLSFRFDKGKNVLSHSVRDVLRRALQISRVLSDDGDAGATSARSLVADLRKQAVSEMLVVPVERFSDLDLDFGISDPGDVATDIESVINKKPANDADLWRKAARAYHFAEKIDDQHRCEVAAVDCLVSQADAHQQNSAMMAAHWLSEAIAELGGVPNQKEKRRALRHKLIDLQANIADEMSPFAHKADITDLVKKAREAVETLDLPDMLFALATADRSPDPEKLVEEANEQIRQHPLSSIFGSSLHDAEGKVVHRVGGSSFGTEGDDDPAVAHQISQGEQIRRQLLVRATIEPVRLTIINKHYISDDLLRTLLQQSPFVPADQVSTFARGFTRFFQGDFISAIYILTPLLESALRYVLKQHGHDVSTFDDATQTQEDRTIASLFSQMREELDGIFGRAITTDIENLFLSKLGPSLRHSVAHGLLHDGSPFGPDAIYACWLMFRLCLIPLFPHRNEIGALLAAA